MAFKPTKQLI